jgi:hypothetical protein
MVRLYRRRSAGWEYWECWPEPAGGLFVHRGVAGERGIAERVPPCAVDAQERLAALVERERRRGFREPDPHQMGLVLVHWPGRAPALRRAEAWMHDVLGWTGLGAYVGFEGTAGLTIMGEAVDPERAVDVLSADLGRSGLPADAVIAVSADEDVIHWPPARRGERFDGP